MRFVLCTFTLMVIAFIVVADPPDPNRTYDYDSDSDGLYSSASALASKYRDESMFNYYASADAFFSGYHDWSYIVLVDIGTYSSQFQMGESMGIGSKYVSDSADISADISASASASCNSASASASAEVFSAGRMCLNARACFEKCEKKIVLRLLVHM